MRKRLQLALMVTPVIATFLSLTTQPVQAADNAGVLTATTDEFGRRIWVNESVAAPKVNRATNSAPSGRNLFTGVPQTAAGSRFRTRVCRRRDRLPRK